MHPDAVKRLKGLVEPALPQLVVKDGQLDVENLFSTLKPAAEFLDSNLDDLVTVEHGGLLYLYVLVDKLIHTEIHNASGKLADLIPENKLQSITQDLLRWWEAVPRRYAFYFTLPSLSLENWHDPVPVANGVVFEEVGPEKVDENVFRGSRFAAAVRGEQEGRRFWSLRVEVAGISMVGSAVESAPASAIRIAKQTLILCRLQNALDERPALLLGPTPESVRGLDLTEGTDARAFTPPAGFASVLGRLTISGDLLIQRSGLLNPAERRRTPEEVVQHFGDRMRPVGNAIERAQRRHPTEREAKSSEEQRDEYEANRHAARLVTAAQWLFDAEIESAPPMAYVQASIGFEALYGGTKGEPVVETLANRVAYALGRSADQRERLRRGFTTFYEKRSEIVHRGSTSLARSESPQLEWGNRTLRQALVNEVRMVRPLAKE